MTITHTRNDSPNLSQIILSVPVVLDLSHSSYAPLSTLLADSLQIEQIADELAAELLTDYSFDSKDEHSKAFLDMYLAFLLTGRGIYADDSRYMPIHDLVEQKLYE